MLITRRQAGAAVDRETVTDPFCSEDEQDFCHRPNVVVVVGGGGGAQRRSPQSSRPIRDRSSFSGRGTGRLRESRERREVGREGGDRRGEGDRQAGRQADWAREERARAREIIGDGTAVRLCHAAAVVALLVEHEESHRCDDIQNISTLDASASLAFRFHDP